MLTGHILVALNKNSLFLWPTFNTSFLKLLWLSRFRLGVNKSWGTKKVSHCRLSKMLAHIDGGITKTHQYSLAHKTLPNKFNRKCGLILLQSSFTYEIVIVLYMKGLTHKCFIKSPWSCLWTRRIKKNKTKKNFPMTFLPPRSMGDTGSPSTVHVLHNHLLILISDSITPPPSHLSPWNRSQKNLWSKQLQISKLVSIH